MGQISWSTQNGICKMTACPSSTSTHFLLRHAQKKNLECLDEKVAYICRLFILFNFFFFFFAFLLFISFFSSHSVYWTCFTVQKYLRKHHWNRQFLPVFDSNFWTFSCISQAPLSPFSWSGYQWKDHFLLQNLSTDDANLGQRWWFQKLNKGQHRSQWVNIDIVCSNWRSSFFQLYLHFECLQRAVV